MSLPGIIESKSKSEPVIGKGWNSEKSLSTQVPQSLLTNGARVEQAEDELMEKTPSGIQKAHKALNTLKYQKHLQAAKTMIKIEESGESVRAMEFANALDGEEMMEVIEEPHEQASLIVKIRYKVSLIINSQKFDLIIGFVILLNSILIGVEISASLEVERGLRPADGSEMVFLSIVEVLCLIAYTFELALRFFVWGIKCLKSGWVTFDFILVSVGLVNMCVIAPMGVQSDKLAPLLVLRVMRLLKLARAVRLLVQFKTLWMLVRGLISSALTVLYTMFLVFIIIYVFGCLSIELITKHPMNDPQHESFDEAFSEIATTHFFTLQSSMLTLVQFVFMDSASGIYFPLITRDPQLCIFFIPLILIVSISLSNLVTAVIVEGALDQARGDKEAQDAYEAERVKRMIPCLKGMFHNFDKNGDGRISAAEVKHAPDEVQSELMKVMVHQDAVEVFNMLDVDNSGTLSIDEFCEGIKRTVTMGDDQVQYMRLHKMIHSIGDQSKELQKVMDLKLEAMQKHIDKRVHVTEMHIDHRVQRLEAKLDEVLKCISRSNMEASPPTLLPDKSNDSTDIPGTLPPIPGQVSPPLKIS